MSSVSSSVDGGLGLFHHGRCAGLADHLHCGFFAFGNRLLRRAGDLDQLFRLAGLFIAGETILRHLIETDALYVVMRGLHMTVRDQDHRDLLTGLNIIDHRALFIQQEGGDFEG